MLHEDGILTLSLLLSSPTHFRLPSLPTTTFFTILPTTLSILNPVIWNSTGTIRQYSVRAFVTYEDRITHTNTHTLSLSFLHSSLFTYTLSFTLFTHDYFLYHLIYNSYNLNLSNWNFTGFIYLSTESFASLNLRPLQFTPFPSHSPHTLPLFLSLFPSTLYPISELLTLSKRFIPIHLGHGDP